MPQSMSLTEQYSGMISRGSMVGAEPVDLVASMMLEGLRSRCRMLLECKWSTARTISWKNYLIAYFFLLLRTCQRLLVNHSITMTGGYQFEKTSKTVGRYLPDMVLMMQCYRTKLMGSPIFPPALNLFTATSSFVDLSLALQTSPQEPSAILSRRVYFYDSLFTYISLLSIYHYFNHEIQLLSLLLYYFVGGALMGKEIIESRSQSQKRGLAKVSSQVEKEEEFLHELEAADPQMTSSMALHSLHYFIKENKIANFDRFRKKALQILRICKICDRWDRLDSIISCQKCEDNYHEDCYKGEIQYQHDKFVCHRCFDQQIPLNKCKVCQKVLERESKLVVCQYCNHEYHNSCALPQKKVCKRCWRLREVLDIRKKSKKIKKEESWKSQIIQSNRNLRDMLQSIKSKKDAKSKFHLLFQRKGCFFRALNLLDSKDSDQIDIYKDQLVCAIKSKDMNYTEDLRDIQFYLQGMQDRSMDFGLANMSHQEEREYLKYKQQPIGPFVVKLEEKKGYDVVADMDIPQRSIICEYVGEVVTLHECGKLDLIRKNDSNMELWIGRNSDQTLVIRPDKWTNLGRFLNGVKNRNCKKNVESMRLCFRGVPVVLLIAKKNIKKGESLCYDYNAGGIVAKIDTSHYV